MPYRHISPFLKGRDVMNAVEIMQQLLANAEFIDMTRIMEEGMPYWPTQPAFEAETIESQELGNESYFRKIVMCEHTGTHIDAVISMNDAMAAGAIEAIRENKDYYNEDGTPNFLAYGVDGTAQGCLLIKEGLLTSTALQSAADLAEKNMEYAEKVVNGEMKVTDVNDYVDAPEINADNVDDYIQIYIDNGELTEDDVKAAEK